jgi:hypothetical protein
LCFIIRDISIAPEFARFVVGASQKHQPILRNTTTESNQNKLKNSREQLKLIVLETMSKKYSTEE